MRVLVILPLGLLSLLSIAGAVFAGGSSWERIGYITVAIFYFFDLVVLLVLIRRSYPTTAFLPK